MAFKMKGSSFYGKGNQSPIPAKGKYTDMLKRAGEKVYDKASQVGEFLKGGLYSDSDGSSGGGVIATGKRYYRNEKRRDDANRKKEAAERKAKKSSATPKKTEEQLARMKAADNKVLADRKKKKSVKDKETARKKAAGIATGFTKNQLAVQAKRKRESNIVYND